MPKTIPMRLADLEKKKNVNYKNLIKSLMYDGGATIPELSKKLNVSIPTTTKIINELAEMGYVMENGKREQTHGRIPTIYDLSPTSGYFLGIDPNHDSLGIALCDFSGRIINERTNIAFQLENSQQCLDELLVKVNDYISSIDIDPDKILQASMNVSGRVNPFEGISYSFFNFLEQPLDRYLTNAIGIPTCIENDTRAMAFGEFLAGCCNGAKNVVFVNASWGIAIGIIVDGELYFGKSGFSGEFGHMHAYDNEVLCRCGKKGCVETEVSGMALLRKTIRSVTNGERSILSDKLLKEKKKLTLYDVLDAIEKEDTLCIGMLQKIATELGKGLAGIINIFNPEVLVIGGELSQTGDYITQPVQMAIKKYSLNIVNEDSEVVTSSLQERAGLVGACLVARSRAISPIGRQS